jgi:hypothetical protein
MVNKSQRPKRDEFEAIAVQALGFIAADAEHLGRFLAASGIGPDMIRQAAREPSFLAGVLDHVVSDEKLLIAFAAHAGLDPLHVSRAQSALSGRPVERDVP